MIALRLVFAAALLGVCVVIARAKVGKLELRSKAIGDFIGLARQLEALIRVNGRTIPDALAECASRLEGIWTGRLAGELARLYASRAPSSGLWVSALVEMAREYEEAAALTREDRQVITLFGDQLASSDLKSIGENYALLYGRIGEKLQESDRDKAVKGRLYHTVGLLAGLAVAIVVI